MLKDTKVKSEQLTAISGTGAATQASTCFADLAFGTYYVHESKAPTGYSGAADQSALINSNSTCTGSPVTKTFSNTPLSKIQVIFTSLGGAGVTNASIVCVTGGSPVGAVSETGSADPVRDDTDETFTNLSPGVYTCTVDVDP